MKSCSENEVEGQGREEDFSAGFLTSHRYMFLWFRLVGRVSKQIYNVKLVIGQGGHNVCCLDSYSLVLGSY